MKSAPEKERKSSLNFVQEIWRRPLYLWRLPQILNAVAPYSNDDDTVYPPDNSMFIRRVSPATDWAAITPVSEVALKSVVGAGVIAAQPAGGNANAERDSSVPKTSCPTLQLRDGKYKSKFYIGRSCIT